MSNIKSTRTWQQIAEEASHERDSNRLVELAYELERAFDARDKELRHKPSDERENANKRHDVNL